MRLTDKTVRTTRKTRNCILEILQYKIQKENDRKRDDIWFKMNLIIYDIVIFLCYVYIKYTFSSVHA